jgi:hypothetical protein
MAQLLTELTSRRRVAFYDDLGHLNPTYVFPDASERLNIDLEASFHLKNLRLISLYFDHIVFMLGNFLNLQNYTQRRILEKVISSADFRAMCDAGVIIFAGYGASDSAGMLHNQLDHAMRVMPEVKNETYRKSIHSVLSQSAHVIREPSPNSDTNVDQNFADYLRVAGEALNLQNEASDAITIAGDVKHHYGFLGTLEYFPRLQALSPNLRRQAAFSFYDAWRDYAEARYDRLVTVQSIRYAKLNETFLTSRRFFGTELPSMLISPEFFEEVLKRFFPKRQFRRLMFADIRLVLGLRNGDWQVFVTEYHRLLQNAERTSAAVARAISEQSPTTSQELAKLAVDETLSGPESHEFAAMGYDWLAQVAPYALGGIRFLPAGLRSQAAESVIRMFLRHGKHRQFRPFLRKADRALASAAAG